MPSSIDRAPPANQTILVVGGAGFIGSHVNKMLHRKGYHTIVLDNLSRGHRAAVRYGTFIHGELSDGALLSQIFENNSIHAVIHFAAYIDVGESVKEPAKYYLNNVSHTLTLLTTMVKYRVNHLIFSSSAAVYGNPIAFPITETHPCNPINPYGESKWIIEKILHNFEVAYGLKYSCLRYFNAAGGDPEGEIKNYQLHTQNLIPRILLSLKNHKETMTIYGTDYPTPDGTCLRDYIHIEDLGTAHIAALERINAGHPSTHYNLGNSQGFSVREILRTVEETLNFKITAIEGERRPGDPPVLIADYTKAREQLNWHPRFSLKQMIQDAWNSYCHF